MKKWENHKKIPITKKALPFHDWDNIFFELSRMATIATSSTFQIMFKNFFMRHHSNNFFFSNKTFCVNSSHSSYWNVRVQSLMNIIVFKDIPFIFLILTRKTAKKITKLDQLTFKAHGQMKKKFMDAAVSQKYTGRLLTTLLVNFFFNLEKYL